VGPLVQGRHTAMKYFGSCSCKRWSVVVTTDRAIDGMSVRVCDCAYCTLHPAALLSDRGMSVELDGGDPVVRKNGDRLASFYCCEQCDDLLAVGCTLGGQLRGAVNSGLLDRKDLLGAPVPIRPRLLTAAEKLARWDEVWGTLHGVGS
jgi:hypothetical protein